MNDAVPQRPLHVYPIIAAALLSFAASPILVRFASEAPGIVIAAWRALFAVLMLTPFALPRIGPELRQFTKRDWGLISAAGVLLGVHFVMWIESLYHTTVASASVLVTMTPIFLAVLGYLVLGERLTRMGIAALILGVTGAMCIGLGDLGSETGGAPNPLLGNGLALTAALIVSIYMLIGRIVRQRRSWLGYVFPLYVVVAVVIWIGAFTLGEPMSGHSTGFYGLCALMALGPSILGHGSFNYALRYVSATLLGVLALFEPVGASVAAFFLFGEVPSYVALAGMVLVAIGVAIAVQPGRFARSPSSSTERAEARGG